MLIFLAIFGFLVPTQGAIALDYPNRPIKMVVGWSPGGASDSSGRLIAKMASEFLGQPIIRVVVPEECVYDRSSTSHAVNLFDMASKYADVMPVAEALKLIGNLPCTAKG